MIDYDKLLEAFQRHYGPAEEWDNQPLYNEKLGCWTNAWRAAQNSISPEATIKVSFRVQEIYQTLSDDDWSNGMYVELLVWATCNGESVLEQQINLDPEETLTISIPVKLRNAEEQPE